MDDQDGLDKLFFELASESRLGILFELQTKNLKMQEVGQKLSLTHTEVFRQLQRLSEALLIEKKPEGTYAITQNGKLLLELSRSFEFVSRFRRSLLSRDLERIPYQFINRLGELSQAKLSVDTNEMINNAEQLILGAEKYLWLIGQRPLSSLNQKANEVSQKGVQVKLLFDENSRKFYDNIPERRNFEKRVVPTVPAIMLINEKMAGINILPTDNRGDSMVLYGSDPKLLKWADDLFLYFWEQGKRCFPV